MEPTEQRGVILVDDLPSEEISRVFEEELLLEQLYIH
jgi:hypothetical protein